MKKVKEGYKLSEKGIVPIEWIIEPFDKCISIKNGQVDPKIEPYCNMPHIGPGNIEKFTGKLLCFNTAKEDMQTSGKYLFDEEDVLYGKINPQLGKVAYPKFKGVCSADMYPLRANKKVLIPLFLKYLLLSQDFFKYSVSVSMRTGMPKINRDELSEYKLLLPMVNEQEKISLILTSVDEQIGITDNLIEKTKELKKGLMQKLLTKGIGHSRFKNTEIGRIPEEWEVVLLNDITSVITKGTTPTTYGYNFEEEGINFIKIESINDTNGTLNQNTFSKISKECNEKLSRSILEEEDILFAIAGATIGKCAIVTKECMPANTNQALAVIRVNKNIDNKFIFHQLRGQIIQNKIENLKTNTAQPNLNLKQIGEFVIVLPRLEEQQKISLILSSVDEQIGQYEFKKEKFQELKKGLMQKLFTGNIRVKG